MESIILSFGLPALVIGMLIEVEILFISGILLVKTSHLNLYGVLLAVFLGAMLHDWIFYILGKLQGILFFQKRPYLQKKLEVIITPFNKNPWLFLLTYRFLIGFRMITLALFGLSGISPAKFLVASLLSNFLWVGSYGFMGYYFADTVLANLEWIKEHKFWMLSIPISVLIFYNFPKLFAQHQV